MLDALTFQKGTVSDPVGDSSQDGISMLIIGTPAPAGLEHLKAVELFGIETARQYGIDAEFDAINDVNVFRHIEQLFANKHPEKTDGREKRPAKCWLYLVPETATLLEMATTHLYAARAATNSEPRLYGLMKNATVTNTVLNGLDADVWDAIPAAHNFFLDSFRKGAGCRVILEGQDYTSPANAAGSLWELAAEYFSVQVAIGQDWDYAESLSEVRQNYADVGALVGAYAALPAHQSAACPDYIDFFNPDNGGWKTPGLSGHQKCADLVGSGDLEILNGKGYVFLIRYANSDATNLSDTWVCAPKKVENGLMNEYNIQLGRINDVVGRDAWPILLRHLKKDFETTPAGEMSPLYALDVEAKANRVFEARADQLSSGSFKLDRSAQAVASGKMRVTRNLQPKGYNERIEVTEFNVSENG